MNINVKFVELEENDLPQADVEKIRQSIIFAVEDAIGFLKQAGFEYNSDLNICCICKESALMASVAMRANLRIEDYKLIRDEMEMMKDWLSSFHHLEISDDAADEFSRHIQENSEEFTEQLRHSSPHEFDRETDIFIYNVANINKLHDLMVHELWHLIEVQKGVFKGSECIHEGTATFIQKRFIGADPAGEDFHKKATASNAMYDMVGKIVDEELKLAQGSLPKLLEKDFRKKLADRVKSEVLPLWFEAFNKESSEQQRTMIINNPHYAAFVENPSHENLIATFRSMGALKWADEMDKQDTSSYVEHLKRVIGKRAKI